MPIPQPVADVPRIRVFGPCLIKLEHGDWSPETMRPLGYCKDQVKWTEEARYWEVKADSRGQEQGSPAELIFFRGGALIECELTKWDEKLVDVIRGRFSEFGGQSKGPRLQWSNQEYVKLLLEGRVDTYAFPRASCRAPIVIGQGTKFSSLHLAFDCHIVDGVLWSRFPTPVP